MTIQTVCHTACTAYLVMTPVEWCNYLLHDYTDDLSYCLYSVWYCHLLHGGVTWYLTIQVVCYTCLFDMQQLRQH